MRKAPVAVLLCRFNDVTSTPHSPTFYEDYFTENGAGTGGAYDYWLQATYGNLSLEGSRVFGWLELSHSSAELAGLTFPSGRGTLWQWGDDAAHASGLDLSPYAVVIVVLNVSTDHGSAGGNRVVFAYGAETWEPTFIFHELGHGLGLNHSWAGNPDQVYGDRWDIMSAMNVWTFTSAFGTPAGPGLNTPNLARLGGLPFSRIWSPTAARPEEHVQLAALGQPQVPGFLAVRVRAGLLNPSQRNAYFLEFRRRLAWDTGIPGDVVLAHEVRPDGLSYLLSPQLVPDSGASFLTSDGDLRATLLAVDSQGVATLKVETRIATEPARCRDIRIEIDGLEREIRGLQEELKSAPTGQKHQIAARIRKAQEEVQTLKAEAVTLACNPLL